METVLLPWGLCLQLKSLTLAASQKSTCYSCEQKLKDRAHSHAQEGTTAVQGENVEELTGQKQWARGLEPRESIFWMTALTIQEIQSWRGHPREKAVETKPNAVLRKDLKDNWGGQASSYPGWCRTRWRKVHMWQGHREAEEEMSGGVKLWIHQVLIKPVILKI